MPNISFDVFFDTDFINITATRAQGAPKAKPAWKTRSIPKLAPKPLPPPSKDSPRPPKLTGPRVTELPEDEPAPKPKAKAAAPKVKQAETPDTDSAPKPKAAAPKKDAPKPKAAPKATPA